MVIFHCYVSSPEGTFFFPKTYHPILAKTSHSLTNVPNGPFWQVSNQVEVHEDFQRHLQGHGSFKTTLLQNKIDVENPPFLWETIGFPHLCLFTPGCIILKNIGNDCSILQGVTSIRLGANISKLERWKMSKKKHRHTQFPLQPSRWSKFDVQQPKKNRKVVWG